MLSEDAQRGWEAMRSTLPTGAYLIGGTAVAVHLGHRESYDLDFFCHDRSLDLDALARDLEAGGGFLRRDRLEGPGTMRGFFDSAKMEFFVDVDDETPQRMLEEPELVAGLRVASLRDLMAMKLNAVSSRGEMRDYFDLKCIDEEGGISIEEGLVLFCERYGVDPLSPTMEHIIRALGYLDDVREDESLPISKEDLVSWWVKRQRALVRSLDQRSRP
jgi:hypothetical protein